MHLPQAAAERFSKADQARLFSTKQTRNDWGVSDVAVLSDNGLHLAEQQVHALMNSAEGILENVPELVGRVHVGCRTVSLESTNIL